MTVVKRLNKLRKHMRERQLDAYIITSADAHQSEYVALHWKSREWISGFNGSAGVVVVTSREAGLWTDGRYFIQAGQQLTGSTIQLHKMNMDGVLTFQEWLKENLPPGARVGLDGRTVSASLYEKITDELAQKDIQSVIDQDLIDLIWNDRPALPADLIYEHDTVFAGKTRLEKLREVRDKLGAKGAANYLIASLDDIAWLFNMRGSDVLCTPVAYAYAFVNMEQAFLFVNQDKLEPALQASLTADGIELRDYDSIGSFLQCYQSSRPFFFDASRVSIYLKKSIPASYKIINGEDITSHLKAVKNTVEIAGTEQSQIRDGAVMVQFIMWLKEAVHTQELEEADVHEKLSALRSRQANSKGPSFITIAGYMENAASMHYTPRKGASARLKPQGILLVDTGGQYLDGTTDITRTILLGPVSDHIRKDFTYVLKAHIGLSRARFLYGSSGSNLDILARKPLWDIGLDYKCGTGHGVGYFLSVHEGPQYFGQTSPQVKLEPGMIITNEPGIYREGEWGIRTENTMLVTEDETVGGNRFMRFETISYCPIDLEGIDPSYLDDEEKAWLNDYHRKVYEKLSPCLQEDERLWLRQATRSI